MLTTGLPAISPYSPVPQALRLLWHYREKEERFDETTKKGVIIRMKTEMKIKEPIKGWYSRINWSWREGKVRNGNESRLLVWDSR
jgi:hypothetical protein